MVKCLQSHNGVALFPRPWVKDHSRQIYSDASDLALAGFCDNDWYCVPFTGNNAGLASLPIVVREILALLLCILTFRNRFKNQQVACNIDNLASYFCVNNAYINSKDDNLMVLVRALYYFTAVNNISHKAFYIDTHSNTIADSLSRLNFDKFYKLQQGANRQMTPAADVTYSIIMGL